MTTFSKVMCLRNGEWHHDGTYNLTNEVGQFVNLWLGRLEEVLDQISECGGLRPVDNRDRKWMRVELPARVARVRINRFWFDVDLPLYEQMGREIPCPL